MLPFLVVGYLSFLASNSTIANDFIALFDHLGNFSVEANLPGFAVGRLKETVVKRAQRGDVGLHANVLLSSGFAWGESRLRLVLWEVPMRVRHQPVGEGTTCMLAMHPAEEKEATRPWLL